VSAFGFLQVRRNTCVLRAAECTVEHDDFSTTRAPDADAQASRAVALGIARDATLVGLLAAGVAILVGPR
jgi:hypothetical protein